MQFCKFTQFFFYSVFVVFGYSIYEILEFQVVLRLWVTSISRWCEMISVDTMLDFAGICNIFLILYSADGWQLNMYKMGTALKPNTNFQMWMCIGIRAFLLFFWCVCIYIYIYMCIYISIYLISGFHIVWQFINMYNFITVRWSRGNRKKT